MLSATTTTFLLGLCLVGGYLLRRMALPKPVPGIPYNHYAAKRIAGDTPEALRHHADTQQILSFLLENAERFKAPVFQLFMRPMGKPWVIVADAREANDILVRRSREFDRSSFFGDMFVSLIPGAMVHMKTNATWKAQRRLVGDTMTPSFLHTVGAPRIFDDAKTLIELWKEKGAGLDIIWAATFGTSIGTTQGQVDLLSGINDLSLPGDEDTQIDFPEAPDPETFNSIITLADSCGIAMRSPFPRIHHRLALNFYPSLAKAGKAKDKLIAEQLDKAWAKFSGAASSDDDVKCAVDLIVQREVQRAAKEGRAPDYSSYLVKDETFNILVAGHETTSTTLCWAMKMLTTHQDVQQRLRSELYAEFADAHALGSLPAGEDLAKKRFPYLDAVLEEILRLSGTGFTSIRVATVDTQVLGHIIPKGTDVFVMTQGASFTAPSFAVDESKRSTTSHDSKDKTGEWDPADIGRFLPERWLRSGDNGEVEFNARAGPSMPFGGGPRGCFGRKLAELELKIMIVLIVWSFRLEPTPPALSSSKAVDTITHQPQQSYVRLAPVS